MSSTTLEGFRLSPGQKHLWQQQAAHPEAAYRAFGDYRIEGNLDKQILRESLETLISRHEILRTTFNCLPEVTVPLQVIQDRRSLRYNDHDLSDLDSQAQASCIETLFQAAYRTPFDFEEGPLLQVTLIRLSANRHRLLLSLPALIADANSLKILLHEILQGYFAALRGESLSAPSFQYVDFSEWKNELLNSEEMAAGRAYWQTQDPAILASLRLPFEQSPPASVFNPDCLSLSFPKGITTKLKTKFPGQSLSSVMLTCWQVLLWRLTQQSSMTVGTARSGRSFAELKHALGPFAQYLPIRCQLTAQKTLQQTLLQVDEALQNADKWQDCFSWQAWLDAANLSSKPVAYPFCYEYESWPARETIGDLAVTLCRQSVHSDHFGVKLTCRQIDETLTANFYYDPSRYAVELIDQLASQFQTLVKSMLQTPESTVSELNILNAEARQQLLVGFNPPAPSAPIDDPPGLPDLFAQQVTQTPDRIAVAFEGQQLTYDELDRRANQLAHYLQSLGVGPEVPVGLCVERSLAMIEGLLAILKAGGAYVPLDPLLPDARLAFMLADSQAPVLVTERKVQLDLPACVTDVVCLATDSAAIAQHSQQRPTNGATLDSLAYVIYTSGSTGQPKGVAIEQRQLLNYLKGIQTRLNLPPASHYATVSTLSADLGNTAIFPALFGGGTLHVVASDPMALAAYFSQHPIDCLKITPSHLEALLTSAQAAHCLPRRCLVLGGEATYGPLIEKIQSLAPDCRILNHYGPTESAVGVLTYVVPHSAHVSAAAVPLGRPLPNTQVYILDRQGQPVPVGVAGELHIGGASLARGYHNRTDLTAEKFIAAPFVGAASQRLYRTGDLGRYRVDGTIEFLGRQDQQVKIRGFRIELGEVEATLTRHSGVTAAVAVVRFEHSRQQLVAYVVLTASALEQPSPDEALRSYLRQQLPEYMVPDIIVVLEQLPLTLNGKVDRQALPSPAQSERSSEHFVAPRDPLELKLAHIWETILAVHPVGVKDNFFDLGGHSLLAVRLMAQIQQQLGQHLPLATLFQGATVEQLAKVLRQSTEAVSWSPLVPIQRQGDKPPLFFVPGAGGNVVCFYDLARCLGADQPFYGLQGRGLDGELEPHSRIEAMAACYIDAVQQVQPQGPYFLGGHSFGSRVAFEMSQQLQGQGHSVGLLVILDTQNPANQATGTEWSEALWLTKIASILESWSGRSLALSAEQLDGLDPQAQLAYFSTRLQAVNLLPSGADTRQVRGLINVFKANHQTHYQPQGKYPTRMAFFQAEEGLAKRLATDPTQILVEWERFAAGTPSLHTVPGDHVTLLAQPHVQALANQLSAVIEQVLAEANS
ncbi:MAG: amino acid adenylation domain-containing protein [Phormidesmis sp.]